MLKWTMIVVALLLLAVIAIVALGALLPRDHVATRSVTVAAPPREVWATLMTPAAFASWRSDVDSVALAPQSAAAPGAIAWREYRRGESVGYVVERAEEPRLLVTRITDTGLPFGGAWTYAIEPSGAGSRVTITERGSVYNPVFRFVSRFIMGHSASIDAYLRALGKKFGGDAVPSDAIPVAMR